MRSLDKIYLGQVLGEDTDSCSVRSWCGVSIQWAGGYCDVRTVKQHFPGCGVAYSAIAQIQGAVGQLCVWMDRKTGRF